MADIATHDTDHATDHGHHSSTGLSNNKLAMWLFLGSECLLFGGLISTYMLYRGRVQNGPHPSQIYDIPFTSVSSFVLLMSSLTMVLAVSSAHRPVAFDAARFLIDALKDSAPIWKKENWDGGSDWGTSAHDITTPQQVGSNPS